MAKNRTVNNSMLKNGKNSMIKNKTEKQPEK